jgi:hypothetical protein
LGSYAKEDEAPAATSGRSLPDDHVLFQKNGSVCFHGGLLRLQAIAG